MIKKLGVLVCNKGCNANCSFCAGKQHRTQQDFDFKYLQSILIENNTTLEEVSISGAGEPLLQPENISEVLHIIKHSNLNLKKIKLYTNGTLLEKSIKRLIWWRKLGLTHLYVTVHNIDPNKSKVTLKTNDQPPTMSEIKEIEDLTGLIVRINIPLFKEGINTPEELNDMINNLRQIGLNNVSYWVIRDNNDKRDRNLSPVFNLPESAYDYTKQTLFPNGELRFDWCV